MARVDPAESGLTIMAVRAHPDDECFTIAGTFARYGDLGYNTIIVTCTGGENGEIVDPSLDTEETRRNLGAVRRKELEASCAILGIRHLELLGYRDSGMAGTPENEDPRSFNKADLDEATYKLVRLIRLYKPNVLVTDNEEGSYGHPDHIMANRISVRAYDAAADVGYMPDLGPPHEIEKLYYTAFARYQIVKVWKAMKELGLEFPWRQEEREADTAPDWGLPDEEIGAIIDIRNQLDRKIQSLLVHRTQIKPDMWMLTLPPSVRETMLGSEVFQRVRARVEVVGTETDLLPQAEVPILASAEMGSA